MYFWVQFFTPKKKPNLVSNTLIFFFKKTLKNNSACIFHEKVKESLLGTSFVYTNGKIFVRTIKKRQTNVSSSSVVQIAIVRPHLTFILKLAIKILQYANVFHKVDVHYLKPMPIIQHPKQSTLWLD
jgi:hypothetical protein